MRESDIARVIQIFEQVETRWALVGAHAVGLLTEPRATADFDFVIEAQKLNTVIKALRKAFGSLDEHEVGAAVRLLAIDVDLIRSTNHPLFKRALEHVRRVDDWNIPRAEVIIVLKFMSAISPWRSADKRAYDIGDVRSIYRTVGREGLDFDLMRELAALVYPGAETEFATLIGRIDRGEPIEV
jgi:hypothetical protein